MMKFVANLAVCSFTMTLISLIYIRISEKLKNVWSARVRRFTWVFILAGFLTPFRPSVGKPAFEIILDSQPINKMSQIDCGAPNYFHINGSKMMLFYLIFALWLAGAVMAAVTFTVKQQRFSEYVSRMSVPCDGKTEKLVGEISTEMKIGEVKTVILPSVQTPMLAGIYKPTVILPENSYTENELRLIIRHELTHYKSRDLLIKLFGLVCRTVHWFNPVMPYILRRLDEVCELACDEAVISRESKDEKKIYCQSIISTVMLQTVNAPKPAVSTDFGNPGHDLQHRLSMIINSGSRKKLGIVCVAVVLMILLSYGVFGVSCTESEANGHSWTTNTTVLDYSQIYATATTTVGSTFHNSVPTASTTVTDAPNTLHTKESTTHISVSQWEITEYRATTMPVTE